MDDYGLMIHDNSNRFVKTELTDSDIDIARQKISEYIHEKNLDELSTKEAILCVYDYVYSLKYDDEVHRKTAYETVVNGTGDCVGKADLFCEFMDRLEIESYVIPIFPNLAWRVLLLMPKDALKRYKEKGHAINCVMIDGEPFLIDCCNGPFHIMSVDADATSVSSEEQILIPYSNFCYTKESTIEIYGDKNNWYFFRYEISETIEKQLCEIASSYMQNNNAQIL